MYNRAGTNAPDDEGCLCRNDWGYGHGAYVEESTVICSHFEFIRSICVVIIGHERAALQGCTEKRILRNVDVIRKCPNEAGIPGRYTPVTYPSEPYRIRTDIIECYRARQWAGFYRREKWI